VKSKIPFIKPSFPKAEEITADYMRIIKSNWYTNFGPFEKKFTEEVAGYVGQGAQVATAANATLGIDLAVRALLVKNQETDNYVIMPSFTFAAGVEVLVSQGYTPVFIDIDVNTWQPSIKQAKRFVEQNKDKVRGILLCNVFGVGGVEVDDWENFAKMAGLPLIIDSAAGFGSEYKEGVPVGVKGDCEVFSLHATKPFCVGEGALVVSRNAELVARIRKLQNFGFNDQVIEGIGTNAKLQEINCAIGCRQLVGFSKRIQARRRTLVRYKKELSKLGASFQRNDELSAVAFASVVFHTSENAEAVLGALSQNGVEARSYYRPLHFQPIFKDKTKQADSLDVTEMIASRIVSLPVHDNMSEEDQTTIIDTIKTCLEP